MIVLDMSTFSQSPAWGFHDHVYKKVRETAVIVGVCEIVEKGIIVDCDA
jgi:hypothetical protein